MSSAQEGDGGRTRTRTLGPLIKSQLLYQLSYAPPNRPLGSGRPPSGSAVYQACAGLQTPEMRYGRPAR